MHVRIYEGNVQTNNINSEKKYELSQKCIVKSQHNIIIDHTENG